MRSHTDEGLLFSLLVYVAAVAGVLALFVVPVVWANGPTVMENAGADHARELLAARRGDGTYPVAKLDHAQLLPAHVVELAARANKAERASRAAHARRQRQQHLAQKRRAAHRARLAERAQHAQSTRHSYARLPQRQHSSGAHPAQY
jgi:hypothetical protein